MKTILFGLLLVLASAKLAKAQEIPPLAPLRGDVASLKDTMKFIQDKLPGKVNYMLYAHDNLAGTDRIPIKRIFVVSEVTADADRCSISFHDRFDNGNNSIVEHDVEILLKEVRGVELMQMETRVQQETAKSGHPELSIKVEPPIAIVIVKSAPNHWMMFNFYDDALSERVSRAFQHAVSLCGGGKPETF